MKGFWTHQHHVIDMSDAIAVDKSRKADPVKILNRPTHTTAGPSCTNTYGHEYIADVNYYGHPNGG